ncbi:hypothetical protein ACFE04_005640 [Oxalis oulophora]
MIGVCGSKPAAAERRASSSSSTREAAQRRLSLSNTTPSTGVVANNNNTNTSPITTPTSTDDKKMKALFKSRKITPVDINRQTRDLLVLVDRPPSTDTKDSKREEKMAELSKNLRKMKGILYGNTESEPVTDNCAQLTEEFFRENTLRLLIKGLPKLNLEVIVRKSDGERSLKEEEERLMMSGLRKKNKR